MRMPKTRWGHVHQRQARGSEGLYAISGACLASLDWSVAAPGRVSSPVVGGGGVAFARWCGCMRVRGCRRQLWASASREALAFKRPDAERPLRRCVCALLLTTPDQTSGRLRPPGFVPVPFRPIQVPFASAPL